MILQRINLGLFAVLGELSATANWRAIAEEIWPFVHGPALHPDGRSRGRMAGTAPGDRGVTGLRPTATDAAADRRPPVVGRPAARPAVPAREARCAGAVRARWQDTWP